MQKSMDPVSYLDGDLEKKKHTVRRERVKCMITPPYREGDIERYSGMGKSNMYVCTVHTACVE